jgi:hypothetical protein
MTWFDLPALMGKRNRVISLNKADFLTQGNPVRLGGLLSSFAQEVSDYIAVAENASGERLRFSQVSHQPGSRSAHFAFITPDNIEGNEDLPALIDFMCYQAGEMGALNVLCDIEESHPLFEHFRRSGFCVFGWETIFRIPAKFPYEASVSNWFKPSIVEENSLRSLYQTLVPPLVQNAEPFTNGGTPRLVYRVNGELLAYVESASGPAGIYLVPVVHPSVEAIQTLLIDLVNHFQGMGRPLYVQVRSYQAWLAEHLLQLGAETAPRFALLVKHLAVGQFNAMREAQRSRADHRQAEPTAPIVNHYANSSSHTDGVK